MQQQQEKEIAFFVLFLTFYAFKSFALTKEISFEIEYKTSRALKKHTIKSSISSSCLLFVESCKHWTPNQHNKAAQPKADNYPTAHVLTV